MKKIKLYLYPHANPHDHDSSGFCENSVPFSKKGIEQHCEIVGPDEAEYFYMGQLNNDRGELVTKTSADFQYFAGNENKHVCDIEGEGGFEVSNRHPIPKWLWNSIITTMGPLKSYSHIKYLFARPTFSHLFMDIIRSDSEEFSFPSHVSFGLRAFLNHRVRAATVSALHNSDFKKEMHINRRWEGLSSVGSQVQKDFIDTMLNNSISLCPRGSGIDSVRFFESCYYNRVPVVISDYEYYLFGEDEHNLDFCFKIHDPRINPTIIKDQLQKIYDTPLEELEQKANDAKKYFETTVREYFADPTLYFLNWLERKNEKK